VVRCLRRRPRIYFPISNIARGTAPIGIASQSATARGAFYLKCRCSLPDEQFRALWIMIRQVRGWAVPRGLFAGL